MRRNWLYKRFASIKTCAWLLGILCIFFLMGTLFPQGKSYTAEGGTLLRALKYIDVLNIFTAPPFLIVAALLFVNQSICSYERLRLLIRKKSAVINEEVLREAPETLNILLPSSDDKGDEAVARALSSLGFRLHGVRNQSEGYSLEKGINPHWPSLIFHVAVILLIAGFTVSYFFAFEGELALLPGETKDIATHSPEARWNRLLGEDSPSGPSKTFKIGLEEFITEYVQYPKLSFPAKGIGRLSLMGDVAGDKVAYTMPEDSLFPKDWMSALVIYDEGNKPRRKKIEVNAPLRYRGITFYQMDIRQKMVVAVGDTGDTIEVKPDQPFEVPGLKERLRVDTLRVGTLYKKAGGQERIEPYANLKLIEEAKQGKEAARSVGRLAQGRPLVVQGVTLILKSWQEASVLSYRYDPGRGLLWVSALALLAGMTFRIWAYWYKLDCLLAEADEGRRVYMRISCNGLLADSKRMVEKIQSALMSLRN